MKRRLLLATALAVALAQSVAAVAAANTITVSPAGAITATSLGKVTLSSSGGLINPSTQCDVTLAGSLNSTINNAAGGTAGSFTSGSAANCIVGSALPRFAPSWGLTLNSAANLSNLTVGLNVTNVYFRVTVAGTACEFNGTVPITLAYTGTGPYTTALATIGTNSIPVVGGSSLCPTSGRLAGTFSFSSRTLTLS